MEKNKEKLEYQRKKFMNRYTIEKLKNNPAKKRVIAIMLDLQGTIDDMTDETTQIFMEQLTKLKTKFNVHQVLLNISTHTDLPSPTLDKYMSILANNLKPHIILDEATYLFGTYNFYTKECNPLPNQQNNYNKTEVFESRYLDNPQYDVIWFGLVDDYLNPNYFRKFQNHRLMAEFIPSLHDENNKKYDNLMSISSLTPGFLGVIECFATYLNYIKDMTSNSIAETQKALIPYLNDSDIKFLIYNHRYHDIIKYLKSHKINIEDYQVIIRELHLTLEILELTSEELSSIKEIYKLVVPHLNPDNKHLLALKKLTETIPL